MVHLALIENTLFLVNTARQHNTTIIFLRPSSRVLDGDGYQTRASDYMLDRDRCFYWAYGGGFVGGKGGRG